MCSKQIEGREGRCDSRTVGGACKTAQGLQDGRIIGECALCKGLAAHEETRVEFVHRRPPDRDIATRSMLVSPLQPVGRTCSGAFDVFGKTLPLWLAV